jgi:hypothetical protein
MAKCDVCEKEDFFAGVACSTTGPISIGFCSICLSMRAEPKYLIDAMIECIDGVKNLNPKLDYIYHNKEDDKYYSFREKKHVSIETENGDKYDTRQEYVDTL